MDQEHADRMRQALVNEHADRLLAFHDRVADAHEAVVRLRGFVLDLAVRRTSLTVAGSPP